MYTDEPELARAALGWQARGQGDERGGGEVWGREKEEEGAVEKRGGWEQRDRDI